MVKDDIFPQRLMTQMYCGILFAKKQCKIRSSCSLNISSWVVITSDNNIPVLTYGSASEASNAVKNLLPLSGLSVPHYEIYLMSPFSRVLLLQRLVHFFHHCLKLSILSRWIRLLMYTVIFPLKKYEANSTPLGRKNGHPFKIRASAFLHGTG